MTERERLTELLEKAIRYADKMYNGAFFDGKYCGLMADYILANGVIVPPCKVGDTVYIPHNSCNERGCPFNGDYGNWRCNYKGKDRCKPFIDEKPFDLIMLKNIGKTVFLTKEEAEKALKEREKNANYI